jgi:hypothetical protein
MNVNEAQAQFDAKIADLTIEAAIECYTILRKRVAKGRDHFTVTAMVRTGNSIEAIIGEDQFSDLMKLIDNARP